MQIIVVFVVDRHKYTLILIDRIAMTATRKWATVLALAEVIIPRLAQAVAKKHGITKGYSKSSSKNKQAIKWPLKMPQQS